MKLEDASMGPICQFLQLNTRKYATGQCSYLKLTYSQQKRLRLVEPFIVTSCSRLSEMHTFHHG